MSDLHNSQGQTVSHETEEKLRKPSSKRYCDLSPEERRKALCRSKSRVMLLRGKIARKPCEVCGFPEAQMHHKDYDKPEDVTWLCKNCHIVEHGEVIGKKLTCAHCDKPHASNSVYCSDHRNKYFRGYRARISRQVKEMEAELRALRERAGTGK